jgi:hypothetical protein
MFSTLASAKFLLVSAYDLGRGIFFLFRPCISNQKANHITHRKRRSISYGPHVLMAFVIHVDASLGFPLAH